MNDYLDTVADQIQWKAAKPVVLRELSDHLEDQCDACLTEGMPQQQAREEAIRRMGDPAEVGRALDQVHRPKSVKGLIAAIGAMLATSLFLWLFVFFDSDDPGHWIWMPLLCSLVGVAVMAALLHLNWNRFLKHLWKIALPVWIAITIMASVYYPGMSGRWTDYCALLTPLTFASFAYGCKGKGIPGLLACGAVLAGLMWILERYMYAALGMICLYVTGAILLISMAHLGTFGSKCRAISAAIVIMALIAIPSLSRVINGIMHQRYLLNYYELLYRQILAHSKLLGAGEAFTTQIFETQLHMSAHSVRSITIVAEGDFFLATIIYRFGWLAGAGLVIALTAFLLQCLRCGLRLCSVWGKMLSVAIIVPMLLQMALHVVNNCFFFIASSQLPLLSYGNTYRMMDLMLLGLLLSSFRSRSILTDLQMPSNKVCKG